MRSIIEALAETRDGAALLQVDDVLSAKAARITADDTTEGGRTDLATLVDLRVQAFRARQRCHDATPREDDEADRLLEAVRGAPLYPDTAVCVAETLADHRRFDDAAPLLEWPDLDRALTVTRLSYGGEPDAVQTAFRYWRLRHVLARQGGDGTFVAASVPPDKATPAGEGAAPDAHVHSDTDAIELAARVDRAVLTLAWLDEASAAGEPVAPYDAWAALVPILEVFRPGSRARSSASIGGLARQQQPLMQLLADVAINHSAALAARLTDALGQRFASRPDRWPTDLRLRLAQQLRLAGITVPWFADSLAAEERALSEQDVHTRLEGTAALVHRYASEGSAGEARRLAMSLVPMAFGIGFRKDYQFDQWVDWLGRALAEPGGSALISDAAWLVRLLDAATPMTEGAPGIAAARLPAVVAAADPAAAVRIFSHLVRHGTVDHLDALAALVAALTNQIGRDEANALRLAMDLTTEIIAPAAWTAFPFLGEALANAAVRVYGATSAAGVVDEVVDRVNIVALATTRSVWVRGLGRPEPVGTDPAVKGSEYGSLVLTDGRRYPRSQVVGLVHGVNDVIALRRDEARDSSFSWMRLLDGRDFSRSELDILIELFSDGSRSGADALAILAESAERCGDTDVARRLAEDALLGTRPDGWSKHWGGGARRRAAAVAVRVGGHDGQVMVYRDLADQAIDGRYFVSLIVNELAEILSAVAPETAPRTTWPEVRRHLEGIAATLPLPDDDPLEHRGTQWWLPSATPRPRPRSEKNAGAALAELAVLHLSHSAWVSRDGAVITLARALQRGDSAAANALADLAADRPTDDVLEYAGRALAVARTAGASTPPRLRDLETTLATHRNQVIRNLAEQPTARQRPLPGRYRLTLPPPQRLVGQPAPMLDPHEEQYAAIAEHTGLALDTLRRIADGYAREQLNLLPTDAAMQDALQAAEFGHYFPHARVWASRAAFGRVMADLRDAGRLDDAPARLTRMLRTVDIGLLNARPGQRPSAIPTAPEAGHDQTLQRWLAETERRADEYVTAADNGHTLLGATGALTVLNWGHLQEELSCGTVVGDRLGDGETLAPVRSALIADLAQPTAPWRPEPGEPLIVSHAGDTFWQWQAADWLSFRPDIASALRWTPDRYHPGRWMTSAGDIAVDAAWWVDGWWTHTSRAFDDTVAQGHVVTLTAAGATELQALVGPLVRQLTLTRTGREDGHDATPVTTVRTSVLRPSGSGSSKK